MLLELTQKEIDELNKKNEILHKGAFENGIPTEEELVKRKEKYAIEKSISRHNTKIDKTYKQYINCLHNNGKFVFYYPFKGMIKDKIKETLNETPYKITFK